MKSLKKLWKERKQKNENHSNSSDSFVEENIIPLQNDHLSRSRKKYTGELLQMDASPFVWFGEEVSHLHISVDDCTGMIVGAYFDHQETLKSYYKVTAQFLEKYVIPVKILTDRRSVFIYNQKKRRIPLLTKEPLLNMDICVKL